MLNVRGGLTNRVKKDGILIPPPKTQPKPRKNLVCYLPFLWSTCFGFFIGLFILLAGCAMSAVGFYALPLTTTFNLTKTIMEGGGHVTTETSVPVTHNEELYKHLKRLVIVGPVVMGFGLTVVVVACTVVFEEREKRLKARPSEKESEEKKQKKGKYDLIVAKFKEEYNGSHVNEGFVADENLKDKRRCSVYSMDIAMKCASNILISPFHHMENNEGKPNITLSTTCLKNSLDDGTPSPEIGAENGWLKKAPLSEKRPNNRLMPLPVLTPLYGEEKDNGSLRDTNSSQGSLSSAINSVTNTPSKPKKEKEKKKTGLASSSSVSLKKEAADGDSEQNGGPREQNGGIHISTPVEPQVTVTEPESDTNDGNCMIVVVPNDSEKHLHPEVLILNETKISPDYDSSDQGSGIIETKWTSKTTTGHR